MKAWQLIQKRSSWIKHYWAKNSIGNTVDPESVRACKWCAQGAIRRVYKSDSEILSAEAKLLRFLRRRWITNWNDAPERTHAQVIEAMRKADV